MKGPVGVTLTKVTPRRQRWCYYDHDDVYDGEVGVVRVGRSLGVIETTLSHSDDVTGAWLRAATSLARGGRLRAPLVAGLVALRGRDGPALDSWTCRRSAWRTPPGFSASDPANPVRGVALCLGGSHVLVYRPDEFGRCHRARAGSRRLLFVEDDNNMRALRAFLGDKHVTVACLGAAAVAEKLAEEWGLHVARPAELTDLFARAYGEAMSVAADAAEEEEAGWISMPDRVARHRMGRPALFARTKARAMTEAEEGPKTQGRRASARRGLSLERMARAALGPEMRLERPAAKADWGSPELGEAEWLQATRDAYLCFEVAARCLQKLGAPIGA